MKSNRSSGTRPELQLRRALHARGLRFRVQFPVPDAPRRRIDVAFTRLRIAVYLDGCFWHGCTVHLFRPKRNQAYWSRKFDSNRDRDTATNALLERNGWIVLRFWEHEMLDESVEAIERAIAERRTAMLDDRAGSRRSGASGGVRPTRLATPRPPAPAPPR